MSDSNAAAPPGAATTDDGRVQQPRGREPAGQGGKAVSFCVPENFDAGEVLPERLRRYSDCANYLVHRVVAGAALRQADGDGFVRLKVE